MQLALLSGAYQARSVIASAQRCVNLYPQVNERESFMMLPQLAGAPTILTHYPTPGLTLLATASDSGWRGLYQANNGTLYGVCGSSVYAISNQWALTKLGTIGTSDGQVCMADNGISLVLVDGSTQGWTIQLSNNAFAQLVDPTGTFVGANFVAYIDTFFLFNKPGTQAFYTSLSNSLTFDPLYIANKTGYADDLVSIAVVQRQIWLIGAKTTEVWYDAGNANFPFAIVEGAFIQHGCVAPYSVAAQDVNVFWLGQDAQGNCIVFQGINYAAERISTHAIEHEFQTYATVSDAIAHVHQIEGHVFYVLTFPSADKTWVYDVSNKLWHERMWMDSNGLEHRHRANCGVFAYGEFVVGDWQNGNLYKYDLNNYTDNGAAIRRIRSFPQVVNELKRIMYRQFVADMQCGATTDPTAVPQIELRWSDDRGVSYGNAVEQPLGQVGQTQINLQWQRLGMARDRVFELAWSTPTMTALNGAFIDVRSAAS